MIAGILLSLGKCVPVASFSEQLSCHRRFVVGDHLLVITLHISVVMLNCVRFNLSVCSQRFNCFNLRGCVRFDVNVSGARVNENVFARCFLTFFSM